MTLSEHLQSGTIKVVGFILRRFSLRTVQRLAHSCGTFFYRHIPVRRDVALANLKLCFPEKSWEELEAILEKSYLNIATVFFEFLYFPKFTKDFLERFVHYPDEERHLIESAFARRKGLILVSGHFSNWELAAMGIGAFSPNPFAIIVHPFHNTAVDRLANKYRGLLGNSTVPMGSSVRPSISQLRANGVVALLADQSAAKESSTAKFFGIDVPTFQGPAMFALRTRAAMQVGFLVRQGDGTYTLELREIEYDDLTDESDEDVKELTQRHVSVLEDYIRKYPDMWLWFHKRFKHVPAFDEILREVKTKR